MERKRTVLIREENSDEEARATLREMEMIDTELGEEKPANCEESKELQEEWLRKKVRLEELILLGNQLNELYARTETEYIEIDLLSLNLDELTQKLADLATTRKLFNLTILFILLFSYQKLHCRCIVNLLNVLIVSERKLITYIWKSNKLKGIC